MTEPNGLPKLDNTVDSPRQIETGSGSRRVTSFPAPAAQREARAVTNLGRVFGQFAELQQQIADQVIAIEDAIHLQQEDLATAQAQLPDLRESINALIAASYEQSKRDESIREHLRRNDAAIASLADTVGHIQRTEAQWQAALDEIIASLIRAKAIINR